MTEPATFDEDDWADLTGPDKKAIGKLKNALHDFEPLAKFAGLGPKSVQNLISKGLAEEGPSCRPVVAPIGYRLTKKGWLAAEWCNGNRMRTYPEN